MAGNYPSYNDNDVSLLKKIADNTGQIVDGGGTGGGGGGTVNTSGDNTWTGKNGFSGQLYRNATAMGTAVIDITKPSINRSLTANEQESFSATPTTDLQVAVFYTADGTARIVSWNVAVYSYGREGDISLAGMTIPASSTKAVVYNYSLSRSRWELSGDPVAVTGTGSYVLATSPALVTPILGTPTSGNLSNCTADGTNGVCASIIPQNSKSAAYTTILSDNAKHIYHPGADTTARTWTIDSNANVAYPIGATLTFVNDTSAGTITIAITSDTLVLMGTGTTGSRTLAANGIATAIKVTATRWVISGTGLT